MRQTIYYIVHILVLVIFVAAYFLRIFISAGLYKTNWTEVEHLKYNVVDAGLSFYLHVGLVYFSYWLFPAKYLAKSKVLQFFTGLATCYIAYYFFFYGGRFYFQNILGYEFYTFQVFVFWQFFLGTTFLIALGNGLRIIIEWSKDASERHLLEKQNFQSEATLLKYQLNPHFLFNTLNNIDSLIIDESPYASPALNKLSDLMNYMIYESEKEKVFLKDEVAYLQSYVELQKLRFANPGMVQFSVNGDVDGKQIAPMLFISFIENTFKHTSLKNKEGNRIEIRIDVKDNQLHFYCVNTIGAIRKDKSSGVGLNLVKRRLDLLYKKNYNLQINNNGIDFEVKLDLKI